MLENFHYIMWHSAIRTVTISKPFKMTNTMGPSYLKCMFLSKRLARTVLFSLDRNRANSSHITLFYSIKIFHWLYLNYSWFTWMEEKIKLPWFYDFFPLVGLLLKQLKLCAVTYWLKIPCNCPQTLLKAQHILYRSKMPQDAHSGSLTKLSISQSKMEFSAWKVLQFPSSAKKLAFPFFLFTYALCFSSFSCRFQVSEI